MVKEGGGGDVGCRLDCRYKCISRDSSLRSSNHLLITLLFSLCFFACLRCPAQEHHRGGVGGMGLVFL